MGSANLPQSVQPFTRPPETLNIDDLEKAALEKALQVTGGSIFAAAQSRGIGKTRAYRKPKQYGLAGRRCRLLPQLRPPVASPQPTRAKTHCLPNRCFCSDVIAAPIEWLNRRAFQHEAPACRPPLW